MSQNLETADGLLNDRADSLATAVAGNDSDISGLTTALNNEISATNTDVQNLETADGLLNDRADSLATAVCWKTTQTSPTSSLS